MEAELEKAGKPIEPLDMMIRSQIVKVEIYSMEDKN